jgi:hypothetical protein
MQKELSSDMPLQWIIDSRENLVSITAEGSIKYADVDACLDAVVGANALGYRKLVDCAAGFFAMNPEEVMGIVARVRDLHRRPVGAIALVLPEESRETVSRLLGALAAANRPFRLFKSKAEAARWLQGLGSPQH